MNTEFKSIVYNDKALITISWIASFSFIISTLIRKRHLPNESSIIINFYLVGIVFCSFFLFSCLVGSDVRGTFFILWFRVFDGTYKRLCLLLFWLLCAFESVLFSIMINCRKRKANTTNRKFFHLTISLIMISGLYNDPLFLALSGHLMLQIFIIIEVFRNQRIEPWSRFLDQMFLIFVDNQDSHDLILTPIFLLSGMFLPLFLDCSMLYSPHWLLKQRHFAGVLSVGVGDSFAAIVGSRMSQNLDINYCLEDKSNNSFESYPEFVELGALVHKYGDLLSLTPFSYFDLASALKKEQNASHNRTSESRENSAFHSALLENLVAEILLFFSIKFDSSNIYKKLNGLIVSINRWCVPKFNARLLFSSQLKLDENDEDNQNDNDDEINDRTNSLDHSGSNCREPSADYSNRSLDKHQASNMVNSTKRIPDFLNLSTVDKLRLFCFLIDAQLACAHDASQLDNTFSDEQQRIVPIAIDSSGRKFWYFGDTWIFLEDGNLFNAEEEEEKVQDVLKNADHSLKKLLEKISTIKNHKNNRKRLTKGRPDKKRLKSVNCLTIDKNGTFNQRILDEACRNLFTSSYFRVICKDSNHLFNLIQAYRNQKHIKQNDNLIKKLEECMLCIQTIEKENIEKLEREAQIRQSARIVILTEKKRQEKEERKMKLLELAKRKKEEDEQKRLTESAIKLCEQSRKQRLVQRQQRIQDQLEQKELIDAGIILPSSNSSCRDDLSSIGSSTEENDYRKRDKPAKKIQRLPAYDWWTPVTSSSFDGSNDAGIFRTLFNRKSSDKRRSNVLGRSLLTDDRRISLIASPTTKLSSSRSNQPLLPEDLIDGRYCSSSNTSFLNSKKALNPQSFYGSSVNGLDKIRNALNLQKMDSSDASDDSDSFMKSSSRKWAPVHPASLLGLKTRKGGEEYENSDK